MNVDVLSVSRPARHAAPTLNVGFVTPHDSTDRRAFSGTAFFAARALEARSGLRLTRLGAPRRPGALDRLMGRTPAPAHLARADLDGLDAVVGLVATPLLDEVARLRPDLPYLHVTDATPAFLREVYGWAVPAEADAAEARVAAHAAAAVYSSDVLASRAAGDLGCPAMRAVSQPFGVNLDVLPHARPGKSFPGPLELLFVGTDWERKGGDIAVAALGALRARGHDARLTIVGVCPERYKSQPAIRPLGFLDKNNRRDAGLLGAAYKAAHLLLVPSRADCTPMVVAEAMAWGTPVLGADVGGIARQIGPGAGRVLPLFTTPAEWAGEIEAMTGARDLYEMMADAAFDRARGHLSWDAWSAGIEALLRKALDSRLAAQVPMAVA